MPWPREQVVTRAYTGVRGKTLHINAAVVRDGELRAELLDPQVLAREYMPCIPSNDYKGMPAIPSNNYKGIPSVPSNTYKGIVCHL